jgi:hypothetical protein
MRQNMQLLMCRHIYRGVWRGLGGGRGAFCLQRETLTFKGPVAQQTTAVYWLGVN